MFYCSDSLRASQNSLVCDSDNLFDFPSPVNHLLSKLTKVIMRHTPLYVIDFHFTDFHFVVFHNRTNLQAAFCIRKTRPHLSDVVFVSVAAHEISICVLSGC